MYSHFDWQPFSHSIWTKHQSSFIPFLMFDVLQFISIFRSYNTINPPLFLTIYNIYNLLVHNIYCCLALAVVFCQNSHILVTIFEEYNIVNMNTWTLSSDVASICFAKCALCLIREYRFIWEISLQVLFVYPQCSDTQISLPTYRINKNNELNKY